MQALSSLLASSSKVDVYERSLKAFITDAWEVIEPGRKLQWNWHLDAVVEHLEAVYHGDIKRLVVNYPPRCMKSLCVAVFYPCWMWTTRPQHQFLSLSHAEKLAIRDAVKSRRLLRSNWFKKHWGDNFAFAGDQNAKGRYENNKNGHRIAQGLSAGIIGEGGDTIIIDDPHDAEKAQSEAERENVLDQYDHGIVTRLNDQTTGSIILIMQRLHEKDLTGHILAKNDDRCVHLKIPMEYEASPLITNWAKAKVQDVRTQRDELLWANRFPKVAVDSLKRDLGSYAASGQLQQRPSPEGGGILKRKWWRQWPAKVPFPRCEFVLQSYDTAFSEEGLESNSYSARTTWGVFYNEREQMKQILMLEAWRDHVDYPDLRKKAKQDYKDWKPDVVLIEKKASGQSLIQDLRRARIPVRRYNPDKDKVARAYAVQPFLENGFVWFPNRRWADAVLHECSLFPNGEYADWVDTCTQAFLYLLKGPSIEYPEDKRSSEKSDAKRHYYSPRYAA